MPRYRASITGQAESSASITGQAESSASTTYPGIETDDPFAWLAEQGYEDDADTAAYLARYADWYDC